RIDYLYTYTKFFSGTDMHGRIPSELFNEHVYLCFVVDHHGLASIDTMNIDNIMWEGDYPHSTNTWPYSPEVTMKDMGDLLTDHQINKITWENAARAYSYDPFKYMAKEETTVGALRKRAAGWDVSEQSTIHLRPGGAPTTRLKDSGPVTIGSMMGGRTKTTM